MPHLFSPITFKNITLKNRIVVSPMCQYSSEDGFANDWHLVHLGSRAVGGASLIICEAAAVSPEGRITPMDLGIYKDEHIEGLKRITTFIQQQGSVAGIQLAHAGRKASHNQPWNGGKLLLPVEGGWQTFAPSAIAFDEAYDTPQEMSIANIEQCIADFKAAAGRSLQAGFSVVEIHAAHGYLINEFLSPTSNHRRDAYGGSFENRIRFLMEIIDAIQEIWPKELPIFVRISATDWHPEGWTIDDSVALSKLLLQKGIDLVDCSSGGNISGVKIPLSPGYQVPLTQQIKHEANIPTGAVGLITSAMQANEIIESNKADIVLLAREMLRDPYFALHAAEELQQQVQWPLQYERAKPAKH